VEVAVKNAARAVVVVQLGAIDRPPGPHVDFASSIAKTGAVK
jgi:hypothetical protein